MTKKEKNYLLICLLIAAILLTISGNSSPEWW